MQLLKFLLNHFLFAGTMFFAANPSGLGDMGGGTGVSDGATTDAGGTSDGASGDDGSISTGDGADASGSEAEGGGSDDERQGADGSADPDAPVDLGDGRTVPAKWKKLFDSAKEQGLEKEVRQLFFANARLSQKFPGGVNEAVKLAETVTEFGGVEGISELKSDNEAFHQDAETYMTEPAKWLGETFENNPEAALKAFALSLDYVSEHHADNYNHLMAKVIINDLNSSAPVHDIYNLLAGLKDNAQAQDLAKKLAKYYNERGELAKKVPEKKVDAERQRLEADRQKLGTEQEQLRNHTVNSQTIPILGRHMTTQIEKLAKEAGFDLKKFAAEQPKAFQSLRKNILDGVMSKASADKTFIKNYRSVMKEGNTTRAVKMMNDKHDAILGDIVRDVAAGFGIKRKAGTKPAAGDKGAVRQAAGQTSGTMTRVSAKPAANEIDWNKTGNRIYDSEAVLKNGKVVTWA